MMRRKEYNVVTRAYAGAMLKAAQKQGVVELLTTQADALARVLASSSRLVAFLASPQITAQGKMDLVAKVFGAQFSPLLLRLVFMLARRGRSGQLASILEYFAVLVEESLGIEPAVVASARPLPASDRQRLTASLEQRTGKRLNIDFQVDPELIGGIVFQCGDLLIDGSLRNGLEEIRQRLAGTQLLGAQA